MNAPPLPERSAAAQAGTAGTGPVRPRMPFVGALMYVLLFVGGLTGSTALARTTYPSPFGGNADILDYFAHHRDAVLLQGVLQGVSAVGLLVLAAALADAAAGRSTDDRAVHPRLIAAAGGLGAAFQLLSALLGWVAVRDTTQSSPALVRALHDLSFVTGGPGAVIGVGVMIGATALALRGALPGWIRPAGLVLCAVALASLLCLATQSAAFLLPVGRFLGMAWLLVVTLLLGRVGRGPRSAGGGR
ncbi:hypothetical protein [Actinacidiphila paucisporea]|uniref:DUF4386 domain-containing protein n=1 Tax=Actinacidiphila paucisporea TaxID=310782 RepID=A0A1M7QVY9_9ACTN|nr:hypothetical protein [Actinacidiphila paucisporea]SHN35996.1 hypothetical protein SAMN05216499_14513 [Actinacidiphila paucisporea]